MLGEGANEGFTIESACLVDAFARWLDAIGHALLIDRKDPIVADRDAINVGCQVLQNGPAITDRFDVHHPVELEHARWQLIVEACFAESR